MNTGNNSKKARLGLWLSTLMSIVGLLLIVLLSYIIEKTLEPDLNGTLLTAVSIIIAIIPPLLWLIVFYRQDRLNPEPKSFVFKTMLLGALVQKAIYIPLTAFVFPGGDAGISTIARNYAAYVVLVALIQESIKLLSVRYSVYPSKEFDEKIDGIIYGSALGLGFAAMTSLDSILTTGGARLSNAASLVVIETFAHASITGLSCYMLGVSKQRKFNIFRLPAAVLLAAALNALTRFLLEAVTRNGFKVNYIVGLIPAAVVAVLVFFVLVVISSRNEKEGASQGSQTLEPQKAVIGILPVWAILVFTIATGFTVGHAARQNAEVWVDNAVNIRYPSNWVQIKDNEDVFRAGNMLKGGAQEFVRVKKYPLSSLLSVETQSEEEKLQNIAAALSIKAGLEYRFYQPEMGCFLEVDGKLAYVVDYTYITNNQSKPGDTNKTSIGYAEDVIAVMGDQVYVITLSARYEDYVLDHKVLSRAAFAFSGN